MFQPLLNKVSSILYHIKLEYVVLCTLLVIFSVIDMLTSQTNGRLFSLNEQTYPTRARNRMKYIKVQEKEKVTTLARISISKSRKNFSVKNKHQLNFLQRQIDRLITDLFPSEHRY